MTSEDDNLTDIPPFARRFFQTERIATRIGDGAVGGKAAGLLRAQAVLADLPAVQGVLIDIPRIVVITTDVFERFVASNRLADLAASDAPDDDKAHAFLRGDLPVDVLGDLRALVEEVRSPLAVRSSSLLEDALRHPLAGVYATKMIPNAAPEPGTRFERLVEAIKFVYASACFASPRRYLRAIDADPARERMAVIVQEVIGRRAADRFYPHLSGVARSWNFYPGGGSLPEDGVVSLALGLGKTIVDGGVCWTYSPLRPTAPPPFASNADRARSTQTSFWAVRMGEAPHDPIRETENLVQANLRDANLDDSLRLVASTWDPRSDRLQPGAHGEGPHVLDFGPMLIYEEPPLNEAVRNLLAACEKRWGEAVEIEFAAVLQAQPTPHARLGLLQVRAMAGAGTRTDLDDAELLGGDMLLASHQSMGNGHDASIRDVVYVQPSSFDASATRAIAVELERLDAALTAEKRPYLLIGFGRWGSSDPWLGIPVRWDQIAGARVIVEATLPQMNVAPSQGAHFFHNVASLGVKYLTVPSTATPGIDWQWLDSQPARAVTAHLRHVRLDAPLGVTVDGRTSRGVVRRPPTREAPA